MQLMTASKFMKQTVKELQGEIGEIEKPTSIVRHLSTPLLMIDVLPWWVRW